VRALAAGTATFTAIVVALISLHWAPTTEHSPIRPEGAWRWVFVVAVIAALAGYVVGAALARRESRGRAVLAIAVAIQLAPLAAPLLLSTDAYTYWAYGRVGAVHDGNPYVDEPSKWPGDPAYRRMGANWRDTTSLYGPVFTLGAEVHAAAVADRPRLAAWLYKALAAVFVLGCTLLAGRIAPNRAAAFAFVGWNPLVALHFAGGGHNDAWMMAAVLAALTLAAGGRERVSGAFWAVSIGIKWVPLVLLPLEFLAHRRRVSLVGLAAGGVAVAAVAFARYGTHWLTAAGGLSRQARSTGSIGLSHVLTELGLGHRAILVVLGVSFLLVYVYLLREARRGRARLGLAAGAFALAQGWLNPWYAMWPVALAATEEDRAARVLALVLTAYLLRDVLPI
jgi:glycosyl transferase family 87